MLKKGTQISAKLIEAIAENQWIVSFQGELLQVQNTTNIEFKEGLMLQLQVVKESPLAFKILPHKRNKKLTFDVHI